MEVHSPMSFATDFVVGGVAGAISKTLVAPLERVKLLLQVQASSSAIQRPYRGFIDCVTRVVKEQGVLSLWRGNVANILRYLPTQTSNFAFKDMYKDIIFRHIDTNSFTSIFMGNLLMGAAAGGTALVFVYPLDVARTRLAADVGVGSSRIYTGVRSCLGNIYNTSGIYGMYRGFGASMGGVVIHRAALFGGYDTLQHLFLPSSTVAPVWHKWVVAQTSATIAGFISYPFDTVRRRMMMPQALYKNTWHCWAKIYAEEGSRGFFNGAAVNVFRSTGTAFVLVLYDEIKIALHQLKRVLAVLVIASFVVLMQMALVGFGFFAKDVHRSRLRGQSLPRLSPSPIDQKYALKFTAEERATKEEKRRCEAIKGAMNHAWSNYERYAFGADEIGPVSGRRRQNVWGDLSVTLVDALDTLYIMGMKDEFERARDWVANNLDFTHLGMDGGIVSVFEVTIRELGGLLGAYAVSQDPVFVQRAVEFADLTAPAFDEDSGVFFTEFNPYTKAKSIHSYAGYRGYLADIGTLQLEMRYLSDITGDPQYAQRGDAFYDVLKREGSYKKTGLFPTHFDPATGKFSTTDSLITIGGYADSFYEYLLKVFIYSGKDKAQDGFLRKAYDAAVDGMETLLLSKATMATDDDSTTTYYYLKDLAIPSLYGVEEQGHLLCFVPGMLALGTVGEEDAVKVARHLDLAKKLMATCYAMYHRQPTGLAADHFSFPDFTVEESVYKLRPETVESLMYLYRITKDPIYREWGWNIFEATEKYAKAQYGYGAVWYVDSLYWVKIEDKMESFFMAETLKYHYLLQSPDSFVPLDEYVFNTEAHPFRIKSKLNTQ